MGRYGMATEDSSTVIMSDNKGKVCDAAVGAPATYEKDQLHDLTPTLNGRDHEPIPAFSAFAVPYFLVMLVPQSQRTSFSAHTTYVT